MKIFESKIVVRYADTDQMGYVYYGKYAEYFEVARVDALKSAGYSYKKVEEEGFMLPVTEYNIKYFKPALYDDEVIVYTSLEMISPVKMQFHHRCFVGENQLNEAKVTLVCIDKQSRKPVPVPDKIKDLFI